MDIYRPGRRARVDASSIVRPLMSTGDRCPPLMSAADFAQALIAFGYHFKGMGDQLIQTIRLAYWSVTRTGFGLHMSGVLTRTSGRRAVRTGPARSLEGHTMEAYTRVRPLETNVGRRISRCMQLNLAALEGGCGRDADCPASWLGIRVRTRGRPHPARYGPGRSLRGARPPPPALRRGRGGRHLPLYPNGPFGGHRVVQSTYGLFDG